MKPYSIYNTWGLHDFGPEFPLTEAKVSTVLDTLERWRRERGIQFDYFQLDCYWFDVNRGYRYFGLPDKPSTVYTIRL